MAIANVVNLIFLGSGDIRILKSSFVMSGEK